MPRNVAKSHLRPNTSTSSNHPKDHKKSLLKKIDQKIDHVSEVNQLESQGEVDDSNIVNSLVLSNSEYEDEEDRNEMSELEDMEPTDIIDDNQWDTDIEEEVHGK